ncbi:MAG: CdaR family protein [Prevotella sp.]
MQDYIAKIVRKMRNSLFRRPSKEFFIFLFFLALSSIFWLMMTLNETFEQEITVPVQLTGVPENVVITTDVDSALRVTVRDKGYTLATYLYGEQLPAVKIPFDAYANKNTGYGVVPLIDIQRQLYQRLMSSSKIQSINPDKMDFYFNYGLSKTVPVRMNGTVVPAKSYYLAHTKFWPEMVTVYAGKNILDSIKYVKIAPIHIVNFEDTVIREVELEKVRGVKCVPAKVRIGLYPDILTEEILDIPIQTVNVPEGKALRLFPSHVEVRFIVGASLFRTIGAERFTVVADYNEAVNNTNGKCNIYLRNNPNDVRSARLAIQQVDFLIEQQ